MEDDRKINAINKLSSKKFPKKILMTDQITFLTNLTNLTNKKKSKDTVQCKN